MLRKAIGLATTLALMTTLFVGCGTQQTPAESTPSDASGNTGDQSAQTEQVDTSGFPEDGELTFVIPYSDSSGTNTVWRAFGAELEKVMDVTVIYENQDGANGAVGTTYFLNQPHDGTYILCSSEGTSMFKANNLIDVDYDDLTPLVLTAANCGILVTYPGSRFDGMDFNEVIAYLQEHPGEVTVGGTGLGAMPWIWWTLFEQVYGVEVNTVDYSGSGEANTQLMGEHIELLVNGYTTGKPLIDAGSISAICVFDTERLEGLPDVPSISEYTNEFDNYMPNGSFFVAEVAIDTPQEVVDILRDAFVKTWESEGYQEWMTNNNGRMLGLTGDEANEYMKHQQAVNSWLLYDSGVTDVSPETYGVERP